MNWPLSSIGSLMGESEASWDSERVMASREAVTPSQATRCSWPWGGAVRGAGEAEATRATGGRTTGSARLPLAPPFRKGLPATASISAVPFAVATSNAARSSQRNAVIRSSSFSPSSRSPSNRRRARYRSTSHSCSCTAPGQNSPCVVTTAGRMSGAVRRPPSTCRSTMAARRA